MGQHNSNFELASEARRAAERFDECEIKVIKETFKDLCHLKGESTRIDKETFLQYLPLPGLLGERLFAVFDKKCSGEIDYEEFVCGLAVTCRGSWDEKVEFIFNIYDMHGQGAVNRQELAALLNHVPKSIMRFGRAVSLDGDPSHHPHVHHIYASHHGRRASAPVQTLTPRSTHTASTGVSEAGHHSPDRRTIAAANYGESIQSATTGQMVNAGSAEGAEDLSVEAGTETRLTSTNLMQLQLDSIPSGDDDIAGSSGQGLTASNSEAKPEALLCDHRSAKATKASHSNGHPEGEEEAGSEGLDPSSVTVPQQAEVMGSRRTMAMSSAVVPGSWSSTNPSAMGIGCRAGVVRRRRHTLQSDASTDDGTSVAATDHPHYAHWEEFTNNDIVNQAFEECDLNHSGKLSFTEFRLWVERNPIVTQFLQSVFPYDEHREWQGDRKHLPFIHNKEFTGSPVPSEAGSPTGEADTPEEETRRLLIRARNITRDPMLREGIARLIEQQAAARAVSSGGLRAPDGTVLTVEGINGHIGSVSFVGAHSQNGDIPRSSRKTTGASHCLGMDLSELSPRSAKALQHQTVAKQGFLWKQGLRLRVWKQRWYVLVGNCIYYYQHQEDAYPRGVMFLTGSFVEPLQEGVNERKGYWGIEISRNNEQNHRRRLYTRSKTEQLRWVKELRKASAVVPIEDDFEIGEELGQGRFSRVCMCVNKHTLATKAVKIITKEFMTAEEKDLLRAEIAIMKLVNHPNIIRMEAVYESKKDIYIVMELHSGGELFDRIVGRPRFSEDEAFTVIEPLVESVAYLHEMGIVHRDLKPENILCGDRIGDIKIADFGLSKMVLPDEIMKMPCGTLTYVAPEVLTLNGYGKESDIWSVGTIMYLLLRGRLPFDGETREEIIENTIHGAIDWQSDPVWASFSEEGKDLVLGMLNKDASQRYKAKDALQHPWITQRVQRREEHPEQFEF